MDAKTGLNNHRTLDDWNDETAHRQWLELRQKSTQTGFDIPAQVRNDAVARLHGIIMKGTGDTYGTIAAQDEMAIKAVHALVKLATVTTSTTTAAAKILESHTAKFSPKSTHPDDVKMEQLLKKIDDDFDSIGDDFDDDDDDFDDEMD